MQRVRHQRAQTYTPWIRLWMFTVYSRDTTSAALLFLVALQDSDMASGGVHARDYGHIHFPQR